MATKKSVSTYFNLSETCLNVDPEIQGNSLICQQFCAVAFFPPNSFLAVNCVLYNLCMCASNHSTANNRSASSFHKSVICPSFFFSPKAKIESKYFSSFFSSGLAFGYFALWRMSSSLLNFVSTQRMTEEEKNNRRHEKGRKIKSTQAANGIDFFHFSFASHITYAFSRVKWQQSIFHRTRNGWGKFVGKYMCRMV